MFKQVVSVSEWLWLEWRRAGDGYAIDIVHSNGDSVEVLLEEVRPLIEALAEVAGVIVEYATDQEEEV